MKEEDKQNIRKILIGAGVGFGIVAIIFIWIFLTIVAYHLFGGVVALIVFFGPVGAVIGAWVTFSRIEDGDL